MKNYYLLALLFALFYSCTTTQQSGTVSSEKSGTLISMKKGPCYGECPIYKMTIFENGTASFKGERFTDMQGLWVKRIPDAEFKALRQTVIDANLWQFDNVYKSMLPDLAAVTITIHEGDRFKSITGKDGRPEVIVEIQELLEGVIKAGDWRQREKPMMDGELVKNEIQVQLRGRLEGNEWAKKYKKQGVKIIQSLSPNGFIFIIGFDTDVITPEDMLKLLKKDRQVFSAEYNRKVGDGF